MPSKEAGIPASDASAGHSATDAGEPPGSILNVRLESKLGLWPSEHERTRPRSALDPLPAKRARRRHRGHLM